MLTSVLGVTPICRVKAIQTSPNTRALHKHVTRLLHIKILLKCLAITLNLAFTLEFQANKANGIKILLAEVCTLVSGFLCGFFICVIRAEVVLQPSYNSVKMSLNC